MKTRDACVTVECFIKAYLSLTRTGLHLENVLNSTAGIGVNMLGALV